MGLNYGRLTRYLIMMSIGMILIVYGIFTIGISFGNDEISDQEIIERARELGMIEITEAYQLNKEKKDDQTGQ